MKRLFTLLLGLCLASSLAAQKTPFTPERGALLDGKTIVKANLTSPIFSNYSFALERILAPGLSLQLGVTTMPKGLPFATLLTRFINDEDFDFTPFRLGSFHLTPELRWYTGGGYGHGFYLMAYYRYQTFSVSGYNLHLDVRDPQAQSYRRVDVELSGKLKTHSLGFGFGVQWLLGRNKNIVLDWNILGAHYGAGKLNLGGTSSREA